MPSCLPCTCPDVTCILQHSMRALTMACCGRVLDQELFPISNTMSGALVHFEPYAMRQLHWHVNFDEWCGSLQALFLHILRCAVRTMSMCVKVEVFCLDLSLGLGT